MRIRRAFLLVCMGLLTCSQLQRMLDLRQPPPRVEPPTLHDAHSWAAADPNPAVPPPAPPPPPPPPRTPPPAAAPPRPNILLIMADDAARDWISASAARRAPHIDSLAASGGGVLGVRFETVWAGPCLPSRVQALRTSTPSAGAARAPRCAALGRGTSARALERDGVGESARRSGRGGAGASGSSIT